MALSDWVLPPDPPPPANHMATVRRALRCSTAEAIFATVHVALTQGIFLTNYVLDMGGTNLVCGIVEALPYLSQSFFLLSPLLVRRLQRRKPVVLVFYLLHRLAWVFLAALLFVQWPAHVRQTLMVLTLLFSNAAAIIAGNAWQGWMADLVPVSWRGSYYGRRNVYLGATSLVVILAGALVLTGADRLGDRRWGYVACFWAAVGSAVFSAWMLSRQYEPPPTRLAHASWRHRIANPLRQRQFRRYVVFMAAWQFSLGLSSAFFGVHMVRVLKMTPAQMGLQAVLSSTIALAATRFWGGPLDRLGTKAVLVASGILISFHVWIWFLAQPGVLWPVWVTVMVGGFAWSGFNLATFNWPQIMARPGERQYAIGLVGMVSGLMFVGGSILGGVLTTVLPQTLFRIGGYEFLHFHVLFALSALGRFGAVVVLARRIPIDVPASEAGPFRLLSMTLQNMRAGRLEPETSEPPAHSALANSE